MYAPYGDLQIPTIKGTKEYLLDLNYLKRNVNILSDIAVMGQPINAMIGSGVSPSKKTAVQLK